MATITIGGKQIAAGLDWRVLPGMTSERKEIDAIAKQANARFGAIVTDEETQVTVLGLATQRATGIICGAAWLAKASARESIVLVEPIEGGRKLWLCAVRAGLPVQGLDLVIDASELSQRLPAFVENTQDPRICSTVDHIESLGFGVISLQSFDELVSGTKPEKLVRIAGASPVVLVVGGVAILSLVGYLGGGAYLNKLARDKTAAEQALQAQKRQAAIAELARKADETHRIDGEKMLRDRVLQQPQVGPTVESMLDTVGQLPTAVDGWNVSAFDCSPKRCMLTWQRTKAGTLLRFLDKADSSGWEVLNVGGDVATTSAPVLLEERTPNVDSLDEGRAFRVALESKLQQLQLIGVSYQLPQAQSIEMLFPKSAADAPALPPKPLPWMVGEATLKGKNLFVLRGSPEYLESPSIAVKRVAADLKTNDWTLEINYATR